MKACPHEDYTSMFTAYTTRKKSKCPSVDTWINKLAYLSEGILLSNKKSEPLIHTRGCVSRYYIEQKKPNIKEYPLHDSICMKFKIRKNSSMVLGDRSTPGEEKENDVRGT